MNTDTSNALKPNTTIHGVIIESPVKVEALQKSANHIWPQTCRIHATCGHILSSPPSLIPLDIDACYSDNRTMPNPDRVKALWLVLNACNAIWIATDPDDEGEVMAQDIASLSHVLRPSRPVYRVRLYGLDDESIHDALINAEVMDEQNTTVWTPALYGHLRRIADRWMAGAFGTAHSPVGRVLSGMLHAASVEQILPPSPFQWIQKPMNLANLLMCHELAEHSIDSIVQSTQKLYENGTLSYPRTASNAYPKGHMHERMKKVHAHQYVQRALGTPTADKQSHQALTPLASVRTLCELMDSLQHGDALSLENTILATTARCYINKPPSTKLMERLSEITIDAQHLKERWIMLHLTKNQLGRPSTYASFVRKQITRNLISTKGTLTEQGRQWHQQQPNWLDTHRINEMDRLWIQCRDQKLSLPQAMNTWLNSLPVEVAQQLKQATNAIPVHEWAQWMMALESKTDKDKACESNANSPKTWPTLTEIVQPWNQNKNQEL